MSRSSFARALPIVLIAAASCSRSEPASTAGAEEATAPLASVGTEKVAAMTSGAILVELFTSQG